MRGHNVGGTERESAISRLGSARTASRTRRIWAIATAVALIWIVVIVSAPAFLQFGYPAIAANIYGFYSYLCHQMPSRTFHLDEFPFAVCSRCFGVYFGLLAGFAAYPVFREVTRIDPPRRIWLFLALVPMAVDWTLGFLGIWDNNHVSRFATGMIVGVACAVFLVPALAELSELISFRQTKRLSR